MRLTAPPAWGVSSIFLTATTLLRGIPSTAATSVNVGLEASFDAPPYLLELLETAALENSTSYFPLLDRIAEGRFTDLTTEKEQYEAFLDLLRSEGHIPNEEGLSSFQLALSLHSAASRIQAHYQYYNTSIDSLLPVAQDAACPVWVHFEGKQYCSPTLERAQQDFKGPANAADLPFDRKLSLDPVLPVSTLYVDINSPLFPHFHQTLSETARTGRTSYRIRYRPSLSPANRPLAISGYGVELALKRTDYIVIDDRNAEKDKNKGDIKVEVDEDANAEEVDDLKPLSASELLGLGLKASTFILKSENPLKSLEKISQDFPKRSSALSQLEYSEEFLEEHTTNRQNYLPAGMNVIWMNGMQVDSRQMDAFALLDRLRHERKLVAGLTNMGFTPPQAVELISHVAIAESKTSGDIQRYDYRDTTEDGKVIIWFNDIEKDDRYKDWPSDTTTLLQRMFPGQMPQIRRDIHNIVVPLDFTDPKDVQSVIETLQTFVQRSIPCRFAVVPTVSSPEAEKQAKVLYYLYENYGLQVMLSYLVVTMADTKTHAHYSEAKLKTITSQSELLEGRIALEPKEIISGEEYQTRADNTRKWTTRLGAQGPNPLYFANGAAMPRDDTWLGTMSNRIGMDLEMVQKKMFEDFIGDDTWIAGQFLETALSHRNAIIIPEDEATIKIVDIGRIITEHYHLYDELPRISPDEDAENLKLTHFIVIADLDSAEGAKMASEAIEFRKQDNAAKIVILHNGSPSSKLNFQSSKLFNLLTARKDLVGADFEGVLDDSAGSGAVKRDHPHEMAETFWQRMQPLIAAFGLQPGQNGVVLNGRVLGPIPNGETFLATDFSALLGYERAKRIEPLNAALTSLGLEEKPDSPLIAARISSLVALSTVSDVPEGIFDTSATVRMNAFQVWQSNHTAIITGAPNTASIHIVASIDPTSELAQRWVPILRVLSELDGVYLKLYLNPRERLQELPIKRFYRHVLTSKPVFSEDGALVDPKASFNGLPKQALLNLALDVPPAWLVAPKDSVHDLDNIKISSIKSGADVNAIYELEHILIEGHSQDKTTGQPPRGAQLLLGTEKDPHFADTLIMANLGYFQFKANPGFWNIRLKPGRSSEIFNIDSIGADGYREVPGDDTTEVTLMSFQGKTLFPRISRKPGHETDDVLEEGPKAGSAGDYVAKASKFASGFLSKVGVVTKAKQADINIFSVASGHLYERMLNIMMVSVMQHTKHTVKFWFIEQFLSPSFKESVPHLAAHYGFQYEMVTYKWPHWLRGQKEKQREIWGYKILFLDVLFPLSLDKVIFVDADQIVRTDMYDLVSLDLNGAPYGFTPMCDSRTEMEGFRFWKQGYWKNFLRGLPYHISALYVVDLKKFRQIAAGDRLRQQYHQLSADPNSLANLDQDLPNHMQMQIPIHSLSQEWLWCETWCSDESLKEAKTIDLCNNPQTKEPKLDRARRQVPEWTKYDDEIANVFREREGKGREDERGENVQEELDIKAAEEEMAKKEREEKVKDEL